MSARSGSIATTTVCRGLRRPQARHRGRCSRIHLRAPGLPSCHPFSLSHVSFGCQCECSAVKSTQDRRPRRGIKKVDIDGSSIPTQFFVRNPHDWAAFILGLPSVLALSFCYGPRPGGRAVAPSSQPNDGNLLRCHICQFRAVERIPGDVSLIGVECPNHGWLLCTKTSAAPASFVRCLGLLQLLLCTEMLTRAPSIRLRTGYSGPSSSAKPSTALKRGCCGLSRS